MKYVAIIIPAYKVTRHILEVINQIGNDIWRIYVVDDACPDGSGKLVEDQCHDSRVRVLYHDCNLGVGGAVMTGYRAAIADGAEVMVKLDGDGQMDSDLIPYLIGPILAGDADYTKGNRFFDLKNINAMPPIRRFGNAILSLMSKLSTGYWDLFDPTNGFTAIHAEITKRLSFNKINQRYFFETDMLFRLNILRAVVLDIPMDAIYGNEVSSLKIKGIIASFLRMHARNTIKRIFYNYYLRDMSLASIELPVGIFLIVFGISIGCYEWIQSAKQNIMTSAGTVMFAALPIILGLQFLMAFIGYDISKVPRRPLHKLIRNVKK